RNGKRRAQSAFGGDGHSRKIAVREHVRNPRRLSGLPNPAREADARLEVAGAGGGGELFQLESWAEPELDAMQEFPFRIERPEAAEVPGQTVANRAQDAKSRFPQRC